MRQLALISAQLPPAVAQRWVARVLNAPYRTELLSPTIDQDYATTLMAQVPGADALLKRLAGRQVEFHRVAFEKNGE
jgi:hypothetical protein